MTAWQLYPTKPDTWQVFAPVIRPRPDQLYPGVIINNISIREAGFAVIARELATHWPEVTA